MSTTATPEPVASDAALEEESESGLKRGLGNRHLQMIAIGGAIGTGLFMGSGKTIHLAGPSILLIYAIIGFFLYFVMRSMGEMLLSNLKYKSFRDIAEANLGPWAGFFSGWTYWVCWIVIGMADIAAVTSYVLWWFPECPQFLPAVLLVILLFVLNIVAVRLFGEIEFWFALIKIIAIAALVFIAVGMVIISFHSDLPTLIGNRASGATADPEAVAAITAAYPDGANASFIHILNLDHGGWFPNGAMGFLAGFQIAFYAFVGIELVGTAAAETMDPERSLPKAINAIPIRVGLFYILALAAIMSVTPYLAIDPAVSPFVNMFALTGLAVAASVINFVVLTSAASSMNSGIYSTSRMMFGLAGSGLAPKAFAKLSGNQVPANALIFSCICVLPGVILLYASGSIMDAFTYATTAASVLFIFVWALIIFSYFSYRKNTPKLHEKSHYKMPWGVPMGWAVLVFFVAMIVILCLDPETAIATAVTPAWFLILFIAYMIRRSREKSSVAAR